MTLKRGKWANPERQFVLHPDILHALTHYNGTGDSFKDCFEARNELLASDPEAIYHNPDHDLEMLEIARERTDRFVMQGHKWPKRRKEDSVPKRVKWYDGLYD